MVEYLERRYATQEKIWVIGFHEHRYDINDPALGAGRKSSQREDVQAFISWLNTNFPNDIEYTTATQTRDIFMRGRKNIRTRRRSLTRRAARIGASILTPSKVWRANFRTRIT